MGTRLKWLRTYAGVCARLQCNAMQLGTVLAVDTLLIPLSSTELQLLQQMCAQPQGAVPPGAGPVCAIGRMPK